jgi:hypothetical protein
MRVRIWAWGSESIPMRDITILQESHHGQRGFSQTLSTDHVAPFVAPTGRYRLEIVENAFNPSATSATKL